MTLAKVGQELDHYIVRGHKFYKKGAIPTSR